MALRRPKFIEKYGVMWHATDDSVAIEFSCIRKGGRWLDRGTGEMAGAGLFEHYRNAIGLLWPEDEHNRWSDLILRSVLDNTVTTVLGPKSSGKTHTCAKFALVDYWVFPEFTTIIMSSTDVRGLELRVWGDVKNLFRRATERFDWLAGKVVDSKHAITTDDVQDEDVRDLRNAIICIPCLSSNGAYVGLGRYSGIKNKRVRLIADEASFMHGSFLDATTNLDGNPDWKAVFLGNPIDPYDPLGKAAEPKDGWMSLPEPVKTTTWRSRFLGGITINLVGTDSPNFDFPQDQPPRYPYLINSRSIASVVEFYGKESHQYYSQCKGVMKTGLLARRVITRELCEQFHASDDVIWEGGERVKIGAVDAAYGNIGGDRCIFVIAEFGKTVDGHTCISFGKPMLVPVAVGGAGSPEDQIASWVKNECEVNGVLAQNLFFDATGRGSLGTAFARLWSAQVNPVEFGGSPTTRPVSLDLYVHDHQLKLRRLKLANEHYSKYVTELWFSVRYAIEAAQVRNLSPEIIEEGCQREWKIVRGDRIEIESKVEMKERVGRSPDIFDAAATAVEGARRRGFAISKLSNSEHVVDLAWLEDMRDKQKQFRRKSALVYS